MTCRLLTFQIELTERCFELGVVIASRVKLALASSSLPDLLFCSQFGDSKTCSDEEKMNINMKGTKRVVCFGVKVGGLNVLKVKDYGSNRKTRLLSLSLSLLLLKVNV